MTKAFDVLHGIGCRQAEKRVGPRPRPIGSVEAMFDRLDHLESASPRWHVALLHIHWWMDAHGPTATKRALRRFWQRGRRGWADEDTWGLDNYLSEVIAGSAAHLRGHTHGYPADLTPESWAQILTEIVSGMEAWQVVTSNHYETDDEADLIARHDLAMSHLSKWWGHLWD